VILQIHYLHSNVCTKKEPSQKRRKKHEHKPYSISRTLEAPSSKTRLTVEQAFSSPSSVWLPLRQDLGNPCTGTERLQLLKLDRQGVGFLVTWKGAERCISLTHWSSIQSREFNLYLVPQRSCFEPALLPADQVVGHVGPEYSVPDGEERLRVVVFRSLQLVVDIMIGGVILEQVLEDVVRQPESTVIVHRLHYSETEEEHGGSWSHTGEQEGEGST
jgi:hypothetical protein